VSEPDLAILITAANRCVRGPPGRGGRNRGGRVDAAVVRLRAARRRGEQPTVSRLAELLGIAKQGAHRLADDMVELGYLERTADDADPRRTRLRLSPAGERIRARALEESRAMEAELRERFGDARVKHLRALLIDFVERHGGADELAAQRSRAVEDPA
jgi:DNA-binding MarR family transcriptional regulator